MSAKDNGGTAAPLYDTEPRGLTWVEPGLTKRDWLAGMALTGMLAGGDYDPEGAAEDAYKFADAMLAERNKND